MTRPPSGHGWTCPACRRLVPARISTCRCGAERSTVEVEEESLPSEGGRRGVRLWEVLAGVAALAAVPLAIRHFREPPSSVTVPQLALMPTPEAPPADARPTVVFAPARPGSASPRPTPSANRHPWGLEIPPPELAPAPAPDQPYGRRPVRGSPRRSAPTAEPSVRSDADVARARGRLEMRGALGIVASRGRQLLSLVRSYQGTCEGGNSSAAGCQRLLAQIGTLAIQVGRALDEAEDVARRSWMQPGDVRDMRREMGLDDRFWDDVANIARQYSR